MSEVGRAAVDDSVESAVLRQTDPETQNLLAGFEGDRSATYRARPREPRPVPRSVMRALAPVVGNRATASFAGIQREPTKSAGAPAKTPVPDKGAIQDILKKRKVPDVVAAIKDIVWVHPNATSDANEDLEKLWGSFGEGLPDAVATHLDIWWSSARLHPLAIGKLPQVSKAREAFKDQTMAKARSNLAANEKLIRAELTKFGLNENSDPDDPRLAGANNALVLPDVKANLEELKRLAGVAKKQKRLQAEMVKKTITFDRAPFSPDHEPAARDQLPNFMADAKAPAQTLWQAMKGQWDTSQQLLGVILNSNPAIFLASNNPVALDQLVNGNPKEQPSKMLHDVWTKFTGVLKNIETARSGLGDVDYRELKPIHDSLRTTGPWTHAFSKWIIDESVEKYESTEYWKKLGLQAAMMAAIVVAEIATMGGATFFIATGLGVGIAAYRAAEAATKANEMKALGGSTARSDLSIVYRGQITASEAEAEAAMLDLALTAGGVAFGAASRVGEVERIALAAKRTQALKNRFAAEIAEDAKLQKQVDALDEVLKSKESAAKAEKQLAEIQLALPRSSPAPQANTLVPGASGKTFKWGVPEGQRIGMTKSLGNTRLAAEKVPVAGAVPLDGGASGVFNLQQWEFGISKQLLAKEGLTPVEYAHLVDTINHEARHAKQYWDIARLKAGQGVGEAGLIKLGYPQQIAKAAMSNKMLASDASAALVETWAESFFGAAGSARRNAVYQAKDSTLQTYLQTRKFAEASDAAMQAAKGAQQHAAVLDARIAWNKSQQAYLKYDEAFAAYLKLPEEVDARAVAGLQSQPAIANMAKAGREDVSAAMAQLRQAENRVAAAKNEIAAYEAIGASDAAKSDADVARALAEDDVTLSKAQLTKALSR